MYRPSVVREELRQFVPTPPPAADVFVTYQLALDFRTECEYRQRHQAHCDWYAATAAEHRREVTAMQGDWNLFRWFVRWRQ
ncbi:MAG: hypothetical protein HC910_03660 [Spirulinaceae cyanobacterium SM2_1_0]|nr:hypothetical protein [Spirulinaceae cyanobacterium SM2_1_0]